MAVLPGGFRFGRRFARTLAGATRLPLLRAGVHLGLFEALRVPQVPAALADRLGLAPDLVEGWLIAAHAHGLLKKRGGEYAIGRFARWVLDAPEAGALHALLDQTALSYEPRLEALPELLKGAPRPSHEAAPAEALRVAAASRLLETRALRALRRIPGLRKARRVLDVGCGEGTYLAGILRRYRDAHGLGIEKDAEVAEAARRNLREAEVWRRAEVRVGDFMALELPAGRFHLALLNHSLHYFRPPERLPLLRRIGEHLAEGGVLAIQTAVLCDAPLAQALGVHANLTSLDLYLRTHRDLHGLPVPARVEEDLREAGFDEVGQIPIAAGGAVRYVWGRRPSD